MLILLATHMQSEGKNTIKSIVSTQLYHIQNMSNLHLHLLTQQIPMNTVLIVKTTLWVWHHSICYWMAEEPWAWHNPISLPLLPYSWSSALCFPCKHRSRGPQLSLEGEIPLVWCSYQSLKLRILGHSCTELEEGKLWCALFRNLVGCQNNQSLVINTHCTNKLTRLVESIWT